MEGGFGGSLSGRTALGPKVVVPWRALLVAGLLCLALAAALYEGLAARHASVPSAGHFRAASHLRSRPSSHQQSLSSLPLGAQGPISDALGAEDPAYRVRASNGGLSAASPTQRFRASFDRSGVTLDSGQTQLGLSLVAMGYGSSLSALGEVAPRVKANRVLYERVRPQRVVRKRAGRPRAGLHDLKGAIGTSVWSADARDGAERQRPSLAGFRRSGHHAQPRGPARPALQRPERHRREGAHTAQLA